MTCDLTMESPNGGSRAAVATRDTSVRIDLRRLEWMRSLVDMSSIGFFTFEVLHRARFAPQSVVVDAKAALEIALATELEKLDPDEPDTWGRRDGLRRHLELINSLGELQCLCLVASLQEAEARMGGATYEDLAESYRRMHARATPEGREVVRLRAEVDRLQASVE